MNILQFIDGYMSGNAWEDLCVQCYTLRYKDEHYTPIPAAHRGDAGIEGFTMNGIAHQCYCPERLYTDNELYEHQRDKLTTDINKLASPAYVKRLQAIGVPTIVEWHFVIPEYKDSRILEHAETKRVEVLDMKKRNPNAFLHISDGFKIIIKSALSFAPEIIRVVRTDLTNVKLNLAIQRTGNPDWSKCESDKVANICRKIKAVMNVDDDADEDLIFVINSYIESYISGMDIMNTLRINAPDFHEEIFKLEQSYKNEVKTQTRMNKDRSMNQTLFNDILNKFEAKLERDFSRGLTQASIGELKQDLIASWLADCSMEFRSV